MQFRCETLPIPVTPGPGDYQIIPWYYSFYYYNPTTGWFYWELISSMYYYTTPRLPLNI